MFRSDFIEIYNETFTYVDQTWGKQQVYSLWQRISEQFCRQLSGLVEKKGLEGMLEYWGGETGTLMQEEAVFTASIQDGVFTARMRSCPSTARVKEAGSILYDDYCGHCPALYVPVAEKHGYEMHWNIERDPETGECTGRCSWQAWKKNL